MPEDSANKYKMFRNYMTNELGITKQDIEAWTKEAVTVEVNRLVGHINLDNLIFNAIHENVKDSIFNSYGGGLTSNFRDMLIQVIRDNIELSMKVK